ncbi:MAG: LPP20 family lipoprotein [Fidelibacterota bacterium]
MRLKFIYRILFTLLLAVSLFAKIPKWVSENSHPQYPSEQYFLGIGISEDRTEAEDLARGNLIKEISVKISSELENVDNELIKDGEVTTTSRMTQKINSAVSANLVGVQIVELEQEKKNYYALAALSKMKYFTTLEIKMDEAAQQVKNLMNDSDNLQEEGFLLTAIDNYNQCQALLSDYSEKSALYTALTGRKYAALKAIDSSSVAMKIQRIVDNTILSVVDGKNQTGISGTKLPETIVLKVLYKSPLHKEVPVQNLPVKIAYKNGDKIDKITTGTDGKLFINITAVPTDETGKEGKVIFQAVFNNVKWDTQLPATTLSYQVETTQVTFAIVVDNAALQKKLAGMIAENGYSVSSKGDFLINANTMVEDEKVIESPFGKMYMVKVSANFNMVDNNNQTIASLQTSGRATEKSAELARQSAVKNIKINRKDLIAFLAKAID